VRLPVVSRDQDPLNRMRIGVSNLLKGLAFAWDLPLISIRVRVESS